jgi:hypothetical protein
MAAQTRVICVCIATLAACTFGQTISFSVSTRAYTPDVTPTRTLNSSPFVPTPAGIDNPPYRPRNLTLPNATQFDLFKNSPFSATCSANAPTRVDGSEEIVSLLGGQRVRVYKAQAKSQARFCDHFYHGNPYFPESDPDPQSVQATLVILPVTPSAAAFFPSWTTTLLNFAVLAVKGTWFLISIDGPTNPPAIKDGEKEMREDASEAKGKDANESQVQPRTPIPKSFYAALLYDIGQSIVWWYNVVQGFRDPLHAPWIDPIVWLTPVGYCFLAWTRDRYRPTLWALAPLALLYFIMTFVTVILRTSRRLGDGSYTLLSSFPTSGDPGSCVDRLSHPAYALYSDPLARQMRKLQAAQFALTFLPVGYTLVIIASPSTSTTFRENTVLVFKFATVVWSVLWVLVGVIRTGILANRGTPFMWDKDCGFVVISMSPKYGYWDVEAKRLRGYVLQIWRTVFGM